MSLHDVYHTSVSVSHFPRQVFSLRLCQISVSIFDRVSDIGFPGPPPPPPPTPPGPPIKKFISGHFLRGGRGEGMWWEHSWHLSSSASPCLRFTITETARAVHLSLGTEGRPRKLKGARWGKGRGVPHPASLHPRSSADDCAQAPCKSQGEHARRSGRSCCHGSHSRAASPPSSPPPGTAPCL